MKRALIVAAFVATAIALAPSPHRTRTASACAFDTPPTTYETTEDRKLYMQAMDLAGFDMLFPKDPFFSQPSMEQGTRTSRTTAPQTYVPPTLLKAIAWIESDMSMGAAALPFGAIGPDLVSFDCGYGIPLVTCAMP